MYALALFCHLWLLILIRELFYAKIIFYILNFIISLQFCSISGA